MGTQKGAHGCATTQPPFLQTPQLPGTATARPEVTRLLPTMHLPPSVFPSFHPLSVSLSVRPSIHSPLRRSFPSHSAFVSLLSLARCSTPPPPRFPSISFRLEHPCHLHACTWYVTVSWTRRDERLKEEEERCFLEGCGR